MLDRRPSTLAHQALRQAAAQRRPAPGPPIQLTHVDVLYSHAKGEGRLRSDVTELAGRDDRYWSTFPYEFYRALEVAMRTLEIEPEEEAAKAKILQKVDHYRGDWGAAGPGKRLESGLDNYEALKRKVERDCDVKESYGPAIAAANREDFASHSKRAYVKDYLKIKKESPARFLVDENLTSRLVEVLSWYVPLQSGTVKGLDNKEAMIKGMQIVITDYIAILNSYSLETVRSAKAAEKSEGSEKPRPEHKQDGDYVEPPREASIRSAGAVTIQGYQVGERSEIKTGLRGALRSGEKSGARDLETRLTERFDTPYVAGHLVADTVGGKNANYNLAPITEAFNTSGDGMAGPEADARARLKAGKVIRYSVLVTYGNKGHGTWSTAVRPTRVEIDITNLKLGPGSRDGSQIDNYVDAPAGSNPKTYDLTPF